MLVGEAYERVVKHDEFHVDPLAGACHAEDALRDFDVAVDLFEPVLAGLRIRRTHRSGRDNRPPNVPVIGCFGRPG